MNHRTKNERPLVIYHGNCADGFTAAWAVWKRFGSGADYYAGVYQTTPPDVTGRHVVLVDFSYKLPVLSEMAKTATSVLVIDHHKSAADDIRQEHSAKNGNPPIFRMDQWDKPLTWERHLGNVLQDYNEGAHGAIIYAYFDMYRSGAGMAWDFFHPGIPRPALVNHVEDRDLWKFTLSGTREINACIFSHPYSFEVWDLLARADMQALRAEGEAIERKHHKDVAELVAVCRRQMQIGEHVVHVASLP